jgi:hypothetical protein
MERVVFPHEKQIDTSEQNKYNAHINPMLNWQKYHPERYK